jgi:hypothetical protein
MWLIPRMIHRLTLIPLSIALLIFPSVRYTLALDGASGTYYGFPVPWNSDALVMSLVKNVYILPLVIDLIFFAILGVLILNALARLPRAVFRGGLVAIWVGGLLGAAMIMVFVLIFRLHVEVWPDPGPFRILEVTPSLGL